MEDRRSDYHITSTITTQRHQVIGTYWIYRGVCVGSREAESRMARTTRSTRSTVSTGRRRSKAPSEAEATAIVNDALRRHQQAARSAAGSSVPPTEPSVAPSESGAPTESVAPSESNNGHETDAHRVDPASQRLNKVEDSVNASPIARGHPQAPQTKHPAQDH